MELTRTAYGTWSGGRYMHFGEPLDEDRYIASIRRAYENGIRTFMTADVYSNGEADTMLGRALSGLPRNSYYLVGLIGHDIYPGKRDGAKGFLRFTDPRLRRSDQFGSYLRMAVEKSLARLNTDHFDALLLHNPDSVGYTSDTVWKGMELIRENKLSQRLGIAPGPANGFSLDVIQCFERFNGLINEAMIILGPMEPWPGGYALPVAEKYNINLTARVVDYGGLFHDDVKPGHQFGHGDHRTFRPAGWVEAGNLKLEQMRPIAEKYGLTLLQLSCLWTLQQPAVKCVVPTLIQEVGAKAKPIEAKIDELAAVGSDLRLIQLKLDEEDVERLRHIGANKGCMNLKGGNPQFVGESTPDQWSMNPELEAVAKRWGIDPHIDLRHQHEKAA